MKWTTIRDRVLTGLGLATAALIVATSFSGATGAPDGAGAREVDGLGARAQATTDSEEERLD